MNNIQCGYLWQCPLTHNTAVVIAYRESHARRWFAENTRPSVPWQFCGIDQRTDTGSTLVLATLNASGAIIYPWRAQA